MVLGVASHADVLTGSSRNDSFPTDDSFVGQERVTNP